MRVAKTHRAGLAGLLLAVSAIGHAENTIGYDPSADPFALPEQAKTEAAADNKLILVIAGGEWCIWCHYLNAFLTDNETSITH